MQVVQFSIGKILTVKARDDEVEMTWILFLKNSRASKTTLLRQRPQFAVRLLQER